MEMNSFQNHALIYKIVNFIESTGQIEIECEGMQGKFAIDLPIDNGKYPEGDQLDNYIRGFIPTWLIERSQKIKSGVNNVETFRTFNTKNDSENPPAKTIYTIADRKFYRNQQLRESDWTQLPDAPLTDIEKELWKEYRQQLRELAFDPNENTEFPQRPDKLSIIKF
jgi:hypothetical protein